MLFVLRSISFILVHLPEQVCHFIASLLGELVFWGIPRRRRSVLSNLAHAFPEKPHRWRVSMARRSCRRMVETGLLSVVYPRLDTERLRTMARTTEELHREVHELLAAGKPTVMVTAHMGAWELCTAMPAIHPHPTPRLAAIYRPLRNRELDDWLRTSRERFGFRMLSRKAGFAEGMNVLRDRGVLGILFDQNARDSGTLSLFFDRVCSTTPLPGLMVEKFDARIAIFFARRRSFWRYDLEMVVPKDQPREANAVTSWLNQWLEETLKADEELSSTWLWAHNRWKTQDVPARRFKLQHRRSILPPDLKLQRRTRYFIRMPDVIDHALRAVPFMRTLRSSRPDAELTVIVKEALAPTMEEAGVFERIIALPPNRLVRWFVSWRLRRRFPDCWIALNSNFSGDFEALLSGCPQRLGIVRSRQWRFLLTHRWKAPKELEESATRITEIWEAFFRAHGLQGEVDDNPAQIRSDAGDTQAYIRGKRY